MKRWLSSLPPDFAKFWLGQTISEFGSRISRAGIPLIAVITLAATPAQMGFLTAAASLPVLLFSLFAGVLVDRLRRRPILVAMDLARMALLLTIPVAALTGHLSFALLGVLIAALGVLTLVFENAYRAYLPSLVSRNHLVEANSRLTTTESLAEIGGPAIAGLLIQVVTAPLAIIFDALSFLFSAACTSLIRQPEPAPEPRAEGRSVWREIAEGARLVARDPVLRTLAVNWTLRSFFGSFYGALYDIFGIRVLGLTPAILGILIAGGGIGALIGALLASRVQKHFGLGKTLIYTGLISALVGFLTPLAGGSALLASAMLITAQIAGDGLMVIYWINATSLQQMTVPDHILGRANASVGFLSQGIAPVGAIIAGLLATLIGTRWTLMICGVGSLATAIWVARSPLRNVKDYTMPAAAPELEPLTK